MKNIRMLLRMITPIQNLLHGFLFIQTTIGLQWVFLSECDHFVHYETGGNIIFAV